MPCTTLLPDSIRSMSIREVTLALGGGGGKERVGKMTTIVCVCVCVCVCSLCTGVAGCGAFPTRAWGCGKHWEGEGQE